MFIDWDTEARRVAEHIAREKPILNRSAFSSIYPGCAIAYGIDDYGTDEVVRENVTRFRSACKKSGIDVLGFEADSRACTWVTIVRADDLCLVNSLLDTAFDGLSTVHRGQLSKSTRDPN